MFSSGTCVKCNCQFRGSGVGSTGVIKVSTRGHTQSGLALGNAGFNK